MRSELEKHRVNCPAAKRFPQLESEVAKIAGKLSNGLSSKVDLIWKLQWWQIGIMVTLIGAILTVGVMAIQELIAAIDASNLVVPKQPMSVMQQMTIPDLLAQIPEEIVQVINAVVNNIPLTTDQIDAWNIAYAAHENAAQIDVTENKQSAALTLETG